MASLEWLENNAYTKHQRCSSHLALACLLAFLSAVWGWPTFSSWRGIYYALQADSGIRAVGYVEGYRDVFRRRNSASRSCKSILKVALEYGGNVYTIDRKGFNFTQSRYERAKESRRVTVYVNPENPAASVLSLGVPPETWIIHSIVGLAELVLLGCSGYFFCLYYRKEEATDV